MSLFPAYGRGGGRGRGGSNRHGRGRDEPDRSSFGYIDRGGGGSSSSNQHHGGGNRDWGNRGRGRSSYSGGGGRGGRNNRNYNDEVVDVSSSDDDDESSGAKNNSRGTDNERKRHKHHSSSDRSHKSRKKKRKRSKSRSRSRSPHSRSHHHHHGNQDNHNVQNDRNWNDNRHRGDGPNHRPPYEGERYERRDQHQQHGFYQQPPRQDFGRQNTGEWGQGHSGWNSNPAGSNPWVLDNEPGDYGRMQQGYPQGRDFGNSWDNRRHDRGNDSRRNNDGDIDRNWGNNRRDEGRTQEAYDFQEQRRVHMSQNFPKKVFLEEVNLSSEFAFRLDTNSNPTQINYRSLGMNQKSTYEFGNGIFGASDNEMSKVYSVFHAFRCKLPDVTNMEESSEDETADKSNPMAKLPAKDVILFGKQKDDSKNKNSSRVDTGKDFDSYSFEHKEGESIKEKVEYYNKEVRNQPKNISLWKEFIQFQDKVFEESNQIFENEEEPSFTGKKAAKKKQKSNRKALLEKKISILEKALEKNPKNLSLHLLRLDYLLELFKPRYVLTEWKKLVTQHQQVAPFWIEYLLFSASQLLIYTNSSTVSVFETCFQKFGLMMNPKYPEFQRPPKFQLLISDITFALSLLLKNAGYMERAVALHQAQLEFDFYCPKNLFKDDTLLNWKEESGIFESFWDAGTPRFGEEGAKGWNNYVDDTPKERINISVSDTAISTFEEDAFESINEEGKSQDKLAKKSDIWLHIESSRSKLYWLPWRKNCSDIDDCEDVQRVIPASDIVNLISPVASVNFISDFDRQAVYFRHVINFILTLREDFLTHTQSVDLVCSPFLATSLTDSSSLFNEIYYWKRLADLYTGVDDATTSKSYHVFAPEGFKLLDLTLPNLTTAPVLKPTIYTMKQIETFEDKRTTLLKENDNKFMEMLYRVVENAIDLLDAEFSCVLFETLVRFEQKLTCDKSLDVKQRIKFVKNLMKHEKLRNSVGGYREMAMLEFFGGNAQKAISLLIKTINLTTKAMDIQDWDKVDWNKDWKSVVNLISMYLQLVELYLEANNDSKAYYTLVQLGNCFQPIDVDLSVDEQWKPKTNDLLKAVRSFEKIMDMLIPNFSTSKHEDDDKNTEILTSEVYYKWGGDACVEFLFQQRNLILEWTTAHALFLYFSKDFDSASSIYGTVLRKLNPEPLSKRESYSPELIRIHMREQLYIRWGNLAARCLTKDPLMNSKFRTILGMALQEFPSSPPLLLLFTDVENQTSVAGKLWRLMMVNLKPESEKTITHWAPLIMGIGLARKIEELEHDEEVGLPSFGLGGPAVPQDTIFYKLDSMISLAELNPGARNCPLLWRVHLKMLALRAREGKDIQRARATFYEAIRHCPSSKAIYLDGITYFPELMKEVSDLFGEKQLLLRLPLEELDVLLEMDEENVEDNNDDDVEEEQEEGNEDIPFNNGKVSTHTNRSEGELGDSD